MIYRFIRNAACFFIIVGLIHGAFFSQRMASAGAVQEAEYAGSKINQFAGFITTELMPALDNRLNTSRDPARRATAGVRSGIRPPKICPGRRMTAGRALPAAADRTIRSASSFARV